MADEEHRTKPRIDCPTCGKNVVRCKDGSVSAHLPPVEQAVFRAGRAVNCRGGYR